MNNIRRSYPLFSQCGLNCGLCPRYHTDGASKCPGCCGDGFFLKRPSCGVVGCAQRHGGVEFCCLCPEYPCKKLEGAECTDSFISHRNMKKDSEKAKRIGISAYKAELDEKVSILEELLAGYNDKRRKSFYCLAVNLLELPDIRTVLSQIKAEIPKNCEEKEKAARAVALFQAMADRRGIELKLNKKK